VLLLVAGIGSAAAEPLCRTILDDGRIVLSRPFLSVGGLACPRIAAVPQLERRPVITQPRMRFTTGAIGPFTTGSLPPLTTFSNSQPAALHH
jgi:hypothetical protein